MKGSREVLAHPGESAPHFQVDLALHRIGTNPGAVQQPSILDVDIADFVKPHGRGFCGADLERTVAIAGRLSIKRYATRG